MYTSVSDGRSYCRLVASLEMSPGNAVESTYSLDGIHYYGDKLIGQNLPASDSVPGFRTGWIATADCLGYPQHALDSAYPIDFRVHKPDMQEYLGREDIARYFATGSGFFAGNSGKDFELEKQTVHLAYRGGLRDVVTDAERLFIPEPGVVVTVPNGLYSRGYGGELQHKGRWAKRVGTNAKGNGIFELGGISQYVFHYPTYDLSDHLYHVNSWFQGHDSLTYPVFGPYTSRYTNWVQNLASFWDYGFSVDIDYDYELIWNNVYHAKFHVHRVVNLGTVPFWGSRSPSDWSVPGPDCFGVADSTSVDVVSYDYPGAIHVGSISRMSVTSSTIDGGLHQSESDSLPNFVSYRFADRRYLNRRTDFHRSVIESLMSDVRPSSFLSSADALNKHLEALSTNHIQTLQKLGAIMDLLPELTKLPRILSRISNGDLSALKDLIDYITDAILRYKFSQAPAARAIEEIAGSDVQRYLESLARSTDYTIYGDFTYVFPDDVNPYGRGSLVLVTRSKIRISQDLSTMVGSLLMANSVGLLPTLSRIWEILPFSFVVDWFTRMNKRLKLVDTQLLYMAFRTHWCVHSYKFLYYPDISELLDYGLESAEDQPFHISAYVREKSVWMPRLRDSRLDFLAAGSLNPLTSGALAWQLFT